MSISADISDIAKGDKALGTIGLVPPSIGEKLISDPTFRLQYEIEVDATWTIAGLTIQRSELLRASRDAYSHGRTSLVDRAGNEWDLELLRTGESAGFQFRNQDRKITIPAIFGAASDLDDRLGGFYSAASDLHLLGDVQEKWSERLRQGPLLPDEFDLLDQDFDDSPDRVQVAIERQLRRGQSTVDTLVPARPPYYRQLAPAPISSKHVVEYGARESVDHIAALRAAYTRFPLDRLLLMSGHQALLNTLDANTLDIGELVEWALANAGTFGRLAAVEVALRANNLSDNEIAGIESIVRELRDGTTDSGGSYVVTSALLQLVIGQFAYSQLFAQDPPYWRRMVAIAHAELIERELRKFSVETDSFANWALTNRGAYFYQQTLLDLRKEPRWFPSMASPQQVRAEVLSRLRLAAQNNENHLPSRLKRLLLSRHQYSIRSHLEFPQSYFCGPLEGGIESPAEVPAEISTHFANSMRGNDLEPSSFAGLVNTALIFKVDVQHAQLAADALRAAQYQLKHVASPDEVTQLLWGLATVASTTRSPALATELRVLVRRYRRMPGMRISAAFALELGLMAAAAHENVAHWATFVGEWATELAFDDLDASGIRALTANLGWLCSAVPQLWTTCGRAITALNTAVPSTSA